MIFEWDDFGVDHQISDMCQSHDCRDQLNRLKELNPAFKATLFAIPSEMTLELFRWAALNNDWIELAVHGFDHSSNYECEKWSYDQMSAAMSVVANFGAFTKIFRAPGWQISDDCIKWLQEKGWILADQGYNDDRRPAFMDAYINYNGSFKISPKVGDPKDVEAYHGHTWNVGALGGEPNGIYEDFVKVSRLVKEQRQFKFISEAF